MTRPEAALLVSVREKEATLGDIGLTFATVTYKGGSVFQAASKSAEKPYEVVAYLAIRCSCSRIRGFECFTLRDHHVALRYQSDVWRRTSMASSIRVIYTEYRLGLQGFNSAPDGKDRNSHQLHQDFTEISTNTLFGPVCSGTDWEYLGGSLALCK